MDPGLEMFWVLLCPSWSVLDLGRVDLWVLVWGFWVFWVLEVQCVGLGISLRGAGVSSGLLLSSSPVKPLWLGWSVSEEMSTTAR